MRKNLVLHIILGVTLSGITANVYTEDAVTEETAEASAIAGSIAMQQESTEPAVDINASAAPAMSSYIQFDGMLSALGGAAADAESTAPGIKRYIDGKSLARNYYQQPPMIPHKIAEYKITINYNKCMSCHGWDTYQKAKATKISQTHFKDRDGKDHSTLAARRYFCDQCHVPQVDAQPLVENEFTPVSNLK